MHALGTLLHISDDASLLHTRGLILQNAGWHVVNRTSRNADALEDVPNVQVLLLCQSVPMRVVRTVMCAMQAQGIPIVRCSFRSSAQDLGETALLQVPVLPMHLVAACTPLLAAMKPDWGNRDLSRTGVLHSLGNLQRSKG